MCALLLFNAAASGGLRSQWALQIDILSGHVRAGVSGKISVNGVPFKAADFRKRSCYVLQRDVLLATATVSLCSPAPTVCTGHLKVRHGSRMVYPAGEGGNHNQRTAAAAAGDVQEGKEAAGAGRPPAAGALSPLVPMLLSGTPALSTFHCQGRTSEPPPNWHPRRVESRRQTFTAQWP